MPVTPVAPPTEELVTAEAGVPFAAPLLAPPTPVAPLLLPPTVGVLLAEAASLAPESSEEQPRLSRVAPATSDSIQYRIMVNRLAP
jgi:hypothetical protein